MNRPTSAVLSTFYAEKSCSNQRDCLRCLQESFSCSKQEHDEGEPVDFVPLAPREHEAPQQPQSADMSRDPRHREL